MLTNDSSYLADRIRNGLVGWFKFDTNDTDELLKIKQKIEDILKDESNGTVSYQIVSVNYVTSNVTDEDILEVRVSQYNKVYDISEQLKLWIDFHETDCSAKPEPMSPYSIGALEQLSVRDFKELIDNIEVIKQDLV